MAAPYDFNNIQPGTVLERITPVAQEFNIRFWIVYSIARDDDDNIFQIHLRQYDINNQTASFLSIGKSLEQIQTQFTFVRQDPPVVGGRRRRSRRVRRSKRRSRRVKKSRRFRRH